MKKIWKGAWKMIDSFFYADFEQLLQLQMWISSTRLLDI